VGDVRLRFDLSRKDLLVISAKKNARLSLPYVGTLKESWRVYRRIVALLRPHWLAFLMSVICILLSTAFALIVPWLLAWVVDVGVHTGRFTDLVIAASAILGVSILRGLAAYGQGYLSQSVSNLVAYDLRNSIYSHLQNLSFSFHDEAETGNLMSRMTVDIEAARNFFPLALLRAILTVATFGAVTVILFTLDWQLALVTLISVPLVVPVQPGCASPAPIMGRRAERFRRAGYRYAGKPERRARCEIVCT
jgi:ABC-type multidrug transport system fused ATPase/permease subunit